MFQHFGLAAAAGAYRCKCGAPNCRGTMDTQPERTRDFGRRLDVWWPGDRRYFRGTITGYSSSQQRHTIKYDDGDQGRLYLPAEKYRCVRFRGWGCGLGKGWQLAKMKRRPGSLGVLQKSAWAASRRLLPPIYTPAGLTASSSLRYPTSRWVDEYGHVVGDTHEPEAGAAARPSATKKRGASEGGQGGGKRHKRSTMELLAGGGQGGGASSGSDLQSLSAAAPLPAAAEAPAVEQRPAAGGVLPGGIASPGKVLDTYTHFNLAAAAPAGAAGATAAAWALPPAAVAAPQLEIPGLRVNAKPSSLLPPPTQAGPLPEALPLDTTSPLATSAGLNPFTFGSSVAPHLDGLTLQHQQVGGAGWLGCRPGRQWQGACLAGACLAVTTTDVCRSI